MHVNISAACGHRHINAEPVAAIHFSDGTRQLHPRRIHRLLLQPAIGCARHDNNHFGRARFLHSRSNRGCNFGRRQILVLDVDKLFCHSDHVEKHPFDLAHFLNSPIGRARAGDGKLYILECDSDVFGPIDAQVFNRRQISAARNMPAVPRQFA